MALTLPEKIAILLVLFLLSLGHVMHAQDSLPEFSLQKRSGNRVIIGWTNPYGNKVRQISIQRSPDSLRQFKTIITLPDPTVPQNGFVDAKAPNDSQYYRLYILLDSGKYQFSRARRPVGVKPTPRKEPTKPAENEPSPTQPETPVQPVVVSPEKKPAPVKKEEKTKVEPEPVVEKYIAIKRRDSLITFINERNSKRFRDSIANRTKDTLQVIHPDTFLIRPFIPKEVYRPSRYIFTDKDGWVNIQLPDARSKQYKVRFYDSDNSFLFEVKDIHDTLLHLDKVNFLHAGWFSFELFENGVIKEKNKVYVGKDF
ncbi:hypothetical protein KJS94_03675 [Flavihumibacter rivuli]|uniref:hypothetical protein n=1 Tax=Flavihumibacter rivuli TaxID=2838156 RepID=UPI001BDF6D78|nr:hypothetical protein [Flavihumibacter rivuli]ULQ57299.1 hypothetical protein KJS94_03675 [Flavihumibacter rivuli]